MAARDHSLLNESAHPSAQARQQIWDYVSRSPFHSLWDLQGVPILVVAKRTYNSLMDDNILGRSAELGYYFLFALFPTLVSASAILGLAASHAVDLYANLLHYMALVIPPSAFGIVLQTFNQTTAASTSGKVTFGLAAALYAASVGFSAIQDSLNSVYKIKESRPFWKARGSAIIITTFLSVVLTAMLGCLLAGDFLAHLARNHIYHWQLAATAVIAARILGWVMAIGLLMLLFAVTYYFGPDIKKPKWHWLSPGAAIGIVGWILASTGLRIYIHFSHSYTVTYGSLGAVIILLTWFYISGLMLLLGAEINSEIAAAAAEKRLTGQTPSASHVAGATLSPTIHP